MPRQPSGGLTYIKLSFKSLGSSCCLRRYPLRENDRLIFAEHDLETAQKICRSFGETEIKDNPSHFSHSDPIPRKQPRLSQTPRKYPHHQALPRPQKLAPIFLGLFFFEGIILEQNL
ncbi:MAG: hypothetical protein K940chlam9_00713 [Chlamydiae bacterium]|nr:hypothetical protein [Chlamydiota bacterium]